jgi:hypothetical protein
MSLKIDAKPVVCYGWQARRKIFPVGLPTFLGIKKHPLE